MCDDRATGEFGLAGPYARLGRIDGRVTVVDLATGAVVARLREPRVTPLSIDLAQQR